MPDKHSKLFSPSASDRWINCPGSVILSENVPRKEETVYSAEGVRAHSFAELYLKSDIPPSLEKIKDEEMFDAVTMYYKYVKSIIEDTAAARYERGFRLPDVDNEIFGTCDCTVLNRGGLHVIDFKYGKGIDVYPENNSQLYIYALGALSLMGDYPLDSNIFVTIVQPRTRENAKIKVYKMRTVRLLEWRGKVLVPAVKRVRGKCDTLRIGKWCRFCPAMALCPKQAENAIALAQTDFANPVFRDPYELSPKKIAQILDFSENMVLWVKAVAGYAHTYMADGKSIPGYKLVRKRTNRSWKNEKKVMSILRLFFTDQDFCSFKLKSAAQIEKMVSGKLLTLVEKEWEKKEGEATIAPKEDRRPSIHPADDFKLIAEKLSIEKPSIETRSIEPVNRTEKRKG